jgi:hypothetical protein
MFMNSYIIYKEKLPTERKSMSTSNYTIQIHDVKSGDKRMRRQLEHLSQKDTGTKSKHLRKLPVKRACVRARACVCVCVFVCVCGGGFVFVYVCGFVFVCHHSSPSMVTDSKQRSYIFTPAFSFMTCTYLLNFIIHGLQKFELQNITKIWHIYILL